MPTYALFAIARKRREITRRIAGGKEPASPLRKALATLDAAEAILREPQAPRMRKPITIPILDAVRTAKRALTTREITQAVTAARGDPPSQTSAVRKRVEWALIKLRARGVLYAMKRPKGGITWRAAPHGEP